MELGRRRVTLETLAAWLLWRLAARATGVEVVPGDAGGCLVSVKLAGDAGFVQERLDPGAWDRLSPKEQAKDAERLRLELERRAAS